MASKHINPRKIAGLLILLAIVGFVGVQSLWNVYVTHQKYTILFPRSTLLTEEAYEIIDEATVILKKDQEIKAKIVGYTSASGDPAANIELSLARAEAVKAEFVYRGITQDRIEIEGKGGQDTLKKGAAESARAYQLRLSRVEITLAKFLENPLEYVTYR